MLAGLALVLATLACQVNLGGPELPPMSDQISEQTADGLVNEWETSLMQAQSADGQLRLILDESQFTSYLQTQLSNQPDPILQSPTVQLQDGLIRVFGIAEYGWLQGRILIEIQPRLTTEDQLTFDIASAQFGPIPLPQSVKDSIAGIVSELLAGSVGPYLTGIQLEALAISDGEMAIVGKLR